jgi:hypothetical protein
MGASRTVIPALPESWRRYWLDHLLPLRLAAMQQTKERSILDPLPVVKGSEAERWRRFGHVWQWWSLDPALKDYFTELG